MILPLAMRDKCTNPLGIRDFESRFGRKPEECGFQNRWRMPETLDALAEQGILFTVLSPFRQSRCAIRWSDWEDVSGAKIDPSRAYCIKLPSERTINVFFYDAPLSQAVAFEKLLGSGERLKMQSSVDSTTDGLGNRWSNSRRMAMPDASSSSRRNMALAYALFHGEKNNLATLTNYGSTWRNIRRNTRWNS